MDVLHQAYPSSWQVCPWTHFWLLLTISIAIINSFSYHPFFAVMLRQEVSKAGMSKAHVRRRKGFRGGRPDEAVRGNAVSDDIQASRASLWLLLLRALSSVAVLNYTTCAQLLLLSAAWRGCTVGIHWAKFWHSAPKTVLLWCAVEGLCAEAHELRSKEGAVCLVTEIKI